MHLTESQIEHENGDYWVLRTASGYHVMRHGITHSTSESSYEDKSIAVARCNYLAKKANEKVE